MRQDLVLTASCLIALVGTTASFAQDAATAGQPAPATQPVAPEDAIVEQNQATIVTVTGKVQVGESRTGPWKDARVGMNLKEGEWVRTGVNSLVNIRVGEEQVFSGTGIALISIDRMRKAVSEANQARTDETDIRLEYGRLLFNVTSTAHANDVEIQAPDATLAIKGTSGGMEVISDQTSAAFGGEMNRGRFTVTYADGSIASINDNSESNSKNPDPAGNKVKKSKVATGAKNAREQEEEGVVDRSTGGGESVNTLGATDSPNTDT
ncbi:MAG: hypothetical protein KDA16_13625, partial [Phycisphaerales bacterium]|nr:hypothetical protein [Phycisphaerales bacterium]